MILLVTPSDRASQCAAALHAETGQDVVIAESLVRATTLLRAGCFLLVVLDRYLVETAAGEEATLFEHLGIALSIQINLALTGLDRLSRDVRTALQRRHREEIAARQSIIGSLQCELNGTLTALLLSVELAQQTPNLPSPAAEKLHTMHELVNTLRIQLEIPAQLKTPDPPTLERAKPN
jgi:signal transduction histidine kinase